MKHVIDYVLLGFKFRNNRIFFVCSKFSRKYPSFGFLSLEEPYSLSEDQFERLFQTSYSKFEESFERDYFLRCIRILDDKLVLGNHVSLVCEQFVCSSCKCVKDKSEMSTYRSMDHSGICSSCIRMRRKNNFEI